MALNNLITARPRHLPGAATTWLPQHAWAWSQHRDRSKFIYRTKVSIMTSQLVPDPAAVSQWREHRRSHTSERPLRKTLHCRSETRNQGTLMKIPSIILQIENYLSTRTRRGWMSIYIFALKEGFLQKDTPGMSEGLCKVPLCELRHPKVCQAEPCRQLALCCCNAIDTRYDGSSGAI